MNELRELIPTLTYQHRTTGELVEAGRIRKDNWRVVSAWIRDELAALPDSRIVAVTPERGETLLEVRGRPMEARPGYTVLLTERGRFQEVLSNSTVYRRYRPYTAVEGTPVPDVGDTPAGVELWSRPSVDRVRAVRNVGTNLPQIVAWAREQLDEWPGLTVHGDTISCDRPEGPRRLEYGDYLVLSSYGEWSIVQEHEMLGKYSRGTGSVGGSPGDALDTLLKLQRKVERAWGRLPDPEDPENVSWYIRQQVLLITDELHEALAHVHWKPWKTPRGFKDQDAYAAELADVLHFILNLYLAAGLTGEDIFRGYQRKHYTNLRRAKSERYKNS